MVSMERELNKLFNDTNYNKENVIIREIWSIKLELQNFFWGVYVEYLEIITHEHCNTHGFHKINNGNALPYAYLY